MSGQCTLCGRRYAAPDLADVETWCMELERRSIGADGVRFAFYRCPCGRNDIIVEVLPLDDEFVADFEKRLSLLETVARQMATHDVNAVIIPAVA